MKKNLKLPALLLALVLLSGCGAPRAEAPEPERAQLPRLPQWRLRSPRSRHLLSKLLQLLLLPLLPQRRSARRRDCSPSCAVRIMKL